MGSIKERKHQSGRTTWKVSLRKKGIPHFYLTFDDLDEACDWMESNEQEYYKDPDKYLKWREEIYYQMHRTLRRTLKHVCRPKVRVNHEK